MLFLFQDANAAAQAATYIPLWVSILGLVGAAIAPVITFLIARGKFQQELLKIREEVRGQRIKNVGDEFKNFEFENAAYAQAAAQIAKYREENGRLLDENHEKTQKLKLKEFEIAEEIGKRKQAVDDRDKVFHKIEELEEKMEFENKDCQERIVQLGLKYEARQRFLEQTLRDSNIDIPEYNETEALKELVHSDGHKTNN